MHKGLLEIIARLETESPVFYKKLKNFSLLAILIFGGIYLLIKFTGLNVPGWIVEVSKTIAVAAISIAGVSATTVNSHDELKKKIEEVTPSKKKI